MMPALALAMTLSAAEPVYQGAVPLDEDAHDSKTEAFWVVGGLVGWLQVGAGVGVIGAAALPHNSLDSTASLVRGGAFGALVGMGVGLMVGWAASKGWFGAQVAVAVPLLVDLLAGVVLLYAVK